MIQDGKYFTVPLDPQWQRTSGMYCSLNCALMDNVLVNRPMRGVERYEEREEWMLQRYSHTIEKTKRNKI